MPGKVWIWLSESPSCCVLRALPDHALDRVLSTCGSWPVDHVSAAVTDARTTLSTIGDETFVYRLASLSKAITAWAVLIAVEEGSVSLEDPVGASGVTLRHCLAHAAGYPFEGREPITRPGSRRIYSNSGIEIAAEHVATRTGIAFATYLAEGLFVPLRLDRTELRGSPAHGVHSCLTDMLIFMREVLTPTLISRSTADEALQVQFPELAGIVPGIGSFDPNPWGLGFEIHGDKYPHWMGRLPSPRTAGHFGGSGTMFWIDPDHGLGCVALTDRPFDEWAETARAEWSRLSDGVIAPGTST